jgi:PPM family protein phosphatase
METGYCWDTGQVRKLNEDSIISVTFELRSYQGTISSGLFIVADGMGGHDAGEVASDLAARTFQAECMAGLLAPNPLPPLTIMSDAFNKANNKVAETAQEKSLHGMGTTLTAALIIGQDLYVAHIGDSRCYIINEHEILQLSKDHSFVQQLVDAGLITPEQARIHPRRNEITRVLGYIPDISPDLFKVKLYSDDIVLLCSDGLHSVLENNKIAGTVTSAANPKEACKILIDDANSEGGPDNISVILAKPSGLPSWQAMINAHTSMRIS